MKHIACWVMLFIGGGLSCYGQDFSVKLLDAPEKVIQGAPVQVTIEIANISGREIVIAKGMNGFRWNLNVMNKDRSRRICPQRMEGGTPIPGNIREVLPKNWRMTMVEDVSCNDKAGEINVQVALVADANEYYILEHDGSHTPFSAWSGQILSKEYVIRIESPTGTDLEAFTQMNGCPLCDQGQLLQRFPTSTYVGYALYSGNPAVAIVQPISIVEERASYEETARKWPHTQPQMTRDAERALKRNQERINTLEAYLKARPDFTYADIIRLELSARYAYQEDYQKARCLSEELLSRAPESTEGKKAQGFLNYLQEKGWVKKQADAGKKPEKP